MTLVQIIGVTEIGLIFGLIAMAVYLTFRIIDFPDLTVDGSYTLGAAVATVLIISGISPFLATIAAFIAGMGAGSVTAYLHVRWHVLGLLAGILTMFALYSVNLRIMGRPNISLMEEPTIFDWINLDQRFMITLFIIALLGLLLLTRFFASRYGLALRATGVNPRVSRAYGVNVNRVTYFTLALSNGIVAMAGALFCQYQRFVDINMGQALIIDGLAAVIIGEAIIRSRRIGLALLGCVIGTLLLRLMQAFALNSTDIGLKASDMNFIKAGLIAGTMILSQVHKKFSERRLRRAS